MENKVPGSHLKVEQTFSWENKGFRLLFTIALSIGIGVIFHWAVGLVSFPFLVFILADKEGWWVVKDRRTGEVVKTFGDGWDAYRYQDRLAQKECSTGVPQPELIHIKSINDLADAIDRYRETH